MKIFWLCDARNSYPLNGEIYLGRQPGAANNAYNFCDYDFRLSNRWLRQGRNLTGDNYFTDINLVEHLYTINTTYVGTIRKNKRDVPRKLFPNRNKVEESSIFCISNYLTLVSYVLKRNKIVILLSFMHYDRAVAIDQKHKPDIILYYNDTKSRVDNFDHFIREYSCKQKVNWWPMVIFFNRIDCAARLNYILCILTFPN